MTGLHPVRLAARLTTVIRFIAILACSAAMANAQPPKIGEINFYGLRKLAPDKILAALAIHSGDTLPPSKGDLEERLSEIPGVVDGRIEAVCCEGANATLFIGIAERGAPRFDTHGAPIGSATLPDDLLTSYHDYLSAVARSETTAARRFEDGFTTFATEQLDLLRDVLRNSSEPDHRAVAAAVIGYVPKKVDVLNDLQYALQDADDAVRANAARSLKDIAVLGRKRPELGIKVAPVWFVEMLNSIALSDRWQATQALVVLTDQPNPAVLDLLRERAVPSLTEMARWKTLDYALPAFLLLGRVAGIPEADLHQQWQAGDRETAIRKAAPKR